MTYTEVSTRSLKMYYISIDAQRAGLSGDIKTMEQYCKKHTKKSKLWKISGQPITYPTTC